MYLQGFCGRMAPMTWEKKDLIFSWKKDDDHDDGLGIEAQTTMMVVIHVNETLLDLTSLSNVHIYLTEFV